MATGGEGGKARERTGAEGASRRGRRKTGDGARAGGNAQRHTMPQSLPWIKPAFHQGKAGGNPKHACPGAPPLFCPTLPR
eukprot:363985-Chlamydomonas_euryale.AAC.11